MKLALPLGAQILSNWVTVLHLALHQSTTASAVRPPLKDVITMMQRAILTRFRALQRGTDRGLLGQSG